MPAIVRKDLILLIIASTVSGALAGLISGFYSVDYSDNRYQANNFQTTSTKDIPQSTTTFALVPVERRADEPLVPPVFLTRRASPVATLYRKPKGTTLEERMLGEDRILGQAVALTSDGWFVTTAGILEDMKIGDLILWINGTSLSIEKGVLDKLNNSVYLKTNGQGLTASAFAHLNSLSSGAVVWLETKASELSSSVVLQDGARILVNEVSSSEQATRRILLSNITENGDTGAAAWDPNGSLIGLIESRAGERVRVLPISSISSSFTSLLSFGEIRHANLGVRALDLATSRIYSQTSGLPARGALIMDDKKTGKTAVMRDSAAAKAGLKSGDVILRVERDILDGRADLGEILSDYRPGASVTLRLSRNGTEDVDVPVVLGSMVTSELLK